MSPRYLMPVLVASTVVVIAAVSPSFARTYSAQNGVDTIGDWKSSNCGFLSDASVAFRASATCPAGRVLEWKFPLTFDFGGSSFEDPNGYKSVTINGTVNAAQADAVRCRVQSWNVLGVHTDVTSDKVQSTVGTFAFHWNKELLVPHAVGVAFAECTVKVPPAATPTWLHGVEHDP